MWNNFLGPKMQTCLIDQEIVPLTERVELGYLVFRDQTLYTRICNLEQTAIERNSLMDKKLKQLNFKME